MVAVLQVMAQMGSYVPADRALFRITDRILTRTGQGDDLAKNRSAFQVEVLCRYCKLLFPDINCHFRVQMVDVNYIIQNFTDNSLIVIDELARSQFCPKISHCDFGC